MTPIQQQRLIGGILLVCVISAIAFFLISGTNQGVEPDTNMSQDNFNSVIEPISDEVEVLDYGQETLVDPEQSSSNYVSTAEIVSSNHTAIKPAPAVQAEPLTQTPSVKPVVPPTASKPEVVQPVVEVKPEITTAPTSQQAAPLATINKQAWLLQLGVFAVKRNAQAIQKQVATLGYDAKIEQIKTDEAVLVYRVRIGPEPDRISVEKIANRLNKELKLKTQILQETP